MLKKTPLLLWMKADSICGIFFYTQQTRDAIKDICEVHGNRGFVQSLQADERRKGGSVPISLFVGSLPRWPRYTKS